MNSEKTTGRHRAASRGPVGRIDRYRQVLEYAGGGSVATPTPGPSRANEETMHP